MPPSAAVAAFGAGEPWNVASLHVSDTVGGWSSCPRASGCRCGLCWAGQGLNGAGAQRPGCLPGTPNPGQSQVREGPCFPLGGQVFPEFLWPPGGCDTAISSRGRSSLHLTPICWVAVLSSLWLRGRGRRRAEGVRENPLLTLLPLSSHVPLLSVGTRVWPENQS